MITGNTGQSNMALHTVIGMFNGGDIRLFENEYVVTHLAPSNIIRVNGCYYRVYDDPLRGLRTWCVDVEVARAKARQMEVVPVDEPLPPLPQPPWCVYEDDEGVPCGECQDCQSHMAEVSWQ